MPYLSNTPTPTTPAKPPKQFPTLVTDLSAALGPSSGLDSADVDPLHIRRLMEAYTSNREEWGPFALADTSRNYTRNLVDEGNGKSNLLILVWSPGKGSSIHDHAGAHCVMKILHGTLSETLYTWPDSSKLQSGDSSPPQITKETLYNENDVAYMSDKLGLHKISNPDPEGVAVSLHLYTPPNAATHGFSVFDEESGNPRHVKQTSFYSVRGLRC